MYLSTLLVCVFRLNLRFYFLRVYVRADAMNSCLCLSKGSLFVFLFVYVWQRIDFFNTVQMSLRMSVWEGSVGR